MSLGMFLTIFNKNSRFQGLGRKSAALHKRRAGTLGVILLMFFGSAANAQSDTLVTTAVDAQMAAKFGQLLVQDNGGRVKPVNTVASELLRKIYRQTSYRSLTADQVLLDMIRRPQLWQNELLIKVSHPDLQALVGAKDGYASFANFVNMHSEENYIIRKQVEAAFAKQPAYRDKLDKDLIAVDERVNILYMMLSGQILRIFPLPNDSAHTWYTPNDGAVFEKDASLFVKNILPIYFESIEQGAQQHNFADADTIFSKIQAFQAKFGKDVFPSESKLKTEILYNKLNIFERIWMYYFLFGFLQLIASFARVLKPTLNIKWPNRIFTTAIFLLFVAHIIGLTMRWYISGHAPWSNGYESMIYIGFATMLSGFLFVKRSPIVVAATAILTSMILMVAHLSWLDPEITNLVPVLKSYWLTIHVAIITASYGFLGLAAILAFINLLLYNFKTDKNQSKLELTIQELTVVNEMTMQIGLFMLTIGTFLGGVWANESWGRYWGWDPKETWALATVLFYAFVSHMRLIPGLRGAFALNLGALLAFSSVLMTYFGVNYYLAGLHSYAKGDPVPIPSFVYYALIVVFSVSLMAWITQRKYRAISDEER
jgi:cytochrome c-type biogenesis protein CcsB